jgi:ribose transport system permease protein
MTEKLATKTDVDAGGGSSSPGAGKGSLRERFNATRAESPLLPAVLGAAGALVLICAILAITTDTFLNPRNLTNVAVSASIFIILGVGQALVMNTAGIDVSIGSTVGLSSSVLGGMIIGAETGIATGILAALGVGLACGLFNGLIIAYLKIPPIIATLGTLTAFRGLAFVYMGSTIHNRFPEPFLWVGRGRVMGIPVPIIVAALVAAWGLYFVRYTKMGRGMTALGGNERAARVAGVALTRYRIAVYSIMGVLAAIAGIIQTGRLGSATATTGTMWELHTIALVVIGGTALFGGQVTIAGVVVGALILGVLENGLVLLGLSAFWQRVFLGLVVIIAVGLRTYKNTSPNTND